MLHCCLFVRIIGPSVVDGAVNGIVSAAFTDALLQSFTEEFQNFNLLPQFGTATVTTDSPLGEHCATEMPCFPA